MKVQLMWGFFPFATKTIPYTETTKTKEFRYGENERIGARPSYQYIGVGNETMIIKAKLLPLVTGGRVQLDLLSSAAELGSVFPLIERTGRIHGFYSLRNIQEVSKQFVHTGAPRVIDVVLEFRREGDDMFNYASILTQQIGAILT